MEQVCSSQTAGEEDAAAFCVPGKTSARTVNIRKDTSAKKHPELTQHVVLLQWLWPIRSHVNRTRVMRLERAKSEGLDAFISCSVRVCFAHNVSAASFCQYLLIKGLFVGLDDCPCVTNSKFFGRVNKFAHVAE